MSLHLVQLVAKLSSSQVGYKKVKKKSFNVDITTDNYWCK